jgi:DNA-binding transcriptional MerR regulator
MATRGNSGVRSETVSTSFERLWTVQDVSDFLGIPVSTLHQWRYLGTGPAAYRVGKHLRYNPATVRAWLEKDCLREVSA